MKNIMNPKHPEWDAFIEELCKKVNFEEDENGKITWNCLGNQDFTLEILKSYTDIDIKKTVEYFKKHGGFCDCEIILNIENRRD